MTTQHLRSDQVCTSCDEGKEATTCNACAGDIAYMNRMHIAQECYLQCLAVESGEGECAEAIATRFPEYITRIKSDDQ
jgi:hypothetical protein